MLWLLLFVSQNKMHEYPTWRLMKIVPYIQDDKSFFLIERCQYGPQRKLAILSTEMVTLELESTN